MNDSTVETIRSMTNKQMVEAILDLQQKVKTLEEQRPLRNVSEKEMTEADALRILNGDLKDKKHKEAAQELQLSYGQVYSCRLEFTFKPIHKKLKDEGFKNPWTK